MDTGVFQGECQNGMTCVTVNIGNATFVVTVAKRNFVQQGQCIQKAINRAYELDFNSEIRVDKVDLPNGNHFVPSKDHINQQIKACSDSADYNNINYSNSKRKSIRTLEVYRMPYTGWQLDILEEEFKICPQLGQERKFEIARRTELCRRRVEVWFQNKRRKLKNVTGQ